MYVSIYLSDLEHPADIRCRPAQPSPVNGASGLSTQTRVSGHNVSAEEGGMREARLEGLQARSSNRVARQGTARREKKKMR